MIRLPTLLLLLFHAGALADRGQSSNRTVCHEVIREMRRDLKNPSPLPLNSTNLLDIIRLQNSSWRVSLCIFLNASKNITQGEKVKKNLEFLKSCLPKKDKSVGTPIFIRERNWDDFRRKLQYYLSILYEKLEPAAGSGPPEHLEC